MKKVVGPFEITLNTIEALKKVSPPPLYPLKDFHGNILIETMLNGNLHLIIFMRGRQL